MAERHNILFLTSWYPHKGDPTLGIFVKRHAEAVHKKHNVCIIYVRSVEGQQSHFETNIHSDNGITEIIVTFRKSKKKLGLAKIINWSRFYIGHQLGWRALKIMSFQPDLVHLNVAFPAGIVATSWKYWKRLPYIVTEHWTGYLPEDNQYNNSWFRKFVTKMVIRNAEEVITVSGGLKVAMQNHGLKNNYTIIPNTVDTNFFFYNTPIENRKNYFLVVADLLDRQKNISGIILTLSHLHERYPNAKLIIIGNGIDKDDLLELTVNLNLTEYVNFMGVQDPVVVRNHMQEAMATVLFSNFENQPCVIAESFACGTPVIATDVGGIKEHLLPEMGYLIPANDSEALLNAMQKIIRTKPFNSHSIRQYALDHFSSVKIGAKFDDLYKKHCKIGD
ncbi:MAG: glycosyltransferase [Bacteroidetes bacterium]|nr:glycosyltransferase [Bacteroidota bacterium]